MLDGAQIGAGLEQVGGAAVAERVREMRLVSPQRAATLRSMCQTALREIGCPAFVPWKR